MVVKYLKNFLWRSIIHPLSFTRLELGLQHNETIDIFTDDYYALMDENSSFGTKSDSHLKASSLFDAHAFWNELFYNTETKLKDQVNP